MNWRTTLVLLVVALVLGVAVLTELFRKPRVTAGLSGKGQRVLTVEAAEITRVRAKREYWNSYLLARAPDGSWQLQEPSTEAANPQAAQKLVQTLADLPRLAVIDLPANDAERYREYGLWVPQAEITVMTNTGEQTLLIGGDTADGAGTYCAISGQDNVYVTSPPAAAVLLAGLETYRGTGEAPAPGGPLSGSGHVQIEDLVVGNGPVVQRGQQLTVQYTGRLEDGTVFDSSSDRGRPFLFHLGAGSVIAGWEEGITGMRVGGKRKLTVPPSLGYGAAGKPPKIPPNATLVFEIELLAAGSGTGPAAVVSSEPVGQPTAAAGAALEVAIRMDNNTAGPVGTYAFTVSYPPDVLRYESVRDGGDGFLETPTVNAETPGQLLLSGVSALSQLRNGRMCLVTFRLLSAPSGPVDIRVASYGPSPLVDTAFTAINHTVDNGRTLGMFRR